MRSSTVVLALSVALFSCSDDAGIGPPGFERDGGAPVPLAAGDVDIRIVGGRCGIGRCGYDPLIVGIRRGRLITVRNLDAVPRTWTARDGTFDSGPIPPGGVFRYRAETVGRFRVFDRTAVYIEGFVEVG